MILQFIDELSKKEIENVRINNLEECPSVGDNVATVEIDGKITMRPVTERNIYYSQKLSIERVILSLGFSSQWLTILVNLAQSIGEQYHDVAKATAMAFIANAGISAKDITYCLRKYSLPSYPSLLLKECLESINPNQEGNDIRNRNEE